MQPTTPTNNLRGTQNTIPTWVGPCGNNPGINDILNAIDNYAALDSHSSSLYRQAVINGNFDICQRSRSAIFENPADGSTTLDMWYVGNGPNGASFPIVTVQQNRTNPGDIPGAFNYMRISYTGAESNLQASSQYFVTQVIENGARYLCGQNRYVTISFWARANVAGKRLGLYLAQGYGDGGQQNYWDILNGTTFSLQTGWVKYSATIETATLVGQTFGTNNQDYLQIVFPVCWGSTYNSYMNTNTTESFGGPGDIDIAQVELHAGTQALNFMPRSFAEELRLCQRYFEKSSLDWYPGDVQVDHAGMYQELMPITLTENNTMALNVQFKVPKRIVPYFTSYSYESGEIGVDIANSGPWTPSFTGSVSKNGVNGVGNGSNTSWTQGYYFQMHWIADAMYGPPAYTYWT